MENGVIGEVMQLYGIPYHSVLPVQKGYRNSSYPVVTGQGTLNLILYKDEPAIAARITRANEVGNFLATAGLPARQQYDLRILELRSPRATRYAAIYEYLDGTTIPWEAYQMEHIKTLGGIMGQMHKLLRGYSGTPLPSVVQESTALQARIEHYFADSGIQTAMRAKLRLTTCATDFTELFNALEAEPHKQPLHMDFVRGNILFTGKAISGILDFEKAAYGHPVFDVARTLAFLLVDCKYKDESKIRKYFLASGYVKRGGGEVHPLLDQLVDFYLLHDFYKFLRHNPYEFLPGNEHFMRTKTRLLRSGLIAEL